MSTFEAVRSILTETLGLGPRGERLTPQSALLGEIPEFDSMAVVSVVAALEERFDILFEDDEINFEFFATVGSLSDLVEAKRGQ